MPRTEPQKMTRDWLAKGVLPPKAAKTHREWAEFALTEEAKDWHNSVADAWEHIVATQQDKVAEAYRRLIETYTGYLANHEPGSKLAVYWTDQTPKVDAVLLETYPDLER